MPNKHENKHLFAKISLNFLRINAYKTNIWINFKVTQEIFIVLLYHIKPIK